MKTFAAVIVLATALAPIVRPTESHAVTQAGNVLCSNGTFFNDSSCPCTGVLVSCPVGTTLLTAKSTLSVLQGVCDDLGPVPCAGMFTEYHEACVIPLGSNVGLSAGRASVSYRVCYDATAVSDCSGAVPTPAGTIVIMSGTGTFETHAETAGPSLLTLGDLPNNDPPVTFQFNSPPNRRITARILSFTGTTENGACEPGPCGWGGCSSKLR